MFEIEGKYNTAICYANTIEEQAVEQIRSMCDCEFIAGNKIRIMPDVHAGAGCTIGTTMTIADKVVPNIVGVDIGCGMYTMKLVEQYIDFETFDEAVHYIPSGMNVWDKCIEPFDIESLHCFNKLKNTERLRCSIGTLGGGNHFIELNRGRDGYVYFVIHSGSRNLGKQVAEYYQNIAIQAVNGRNDYKKRCEMLIAEYKAAGRQGEIQSALAKLKSEKHDNTMPDALCYVSGDDFKHYIHDMEICQKFAKRNRELIARTILERTGLHVLRAFHTMHNYIDVDEMILRKGSIQAHKDQLVLIPINMRDGSILGTGKGNADWNYSAPHGAGRIMSRTKAKESISIEDYKQAMSGIYSTSVNISTIDEAPMAYKSMDEIIETIKDTVNIVDILKPIYNFKASQ